VRILACLLLIGGASVGAQPAEAPLQKKRPKAPNVAKSPAGIDKERRELESVSRTMKKRNEKPAKNSARNER
jgi:hypothetical protein